MMARVIETQFPARCRVQWAFTICESDPSLSLCPRFRIGLNWPANQNTRPLSSPGISASACALSNENFKGNCAPARNKNSMLVGKRKRRGSHDKESEQKKSPFDWITKGFRTFADIGRPLTAKESGRGEIRTRDFFAPVWSQSLACPTVILSAPPSTCQRCKSRPSSRGQFSSVQVMNTWPRAW